MSDSSNRRHIINMGHQFSTKQCTICICVWRKYLCCFHGSRISTRFLFHSKHLLFRSKQSLLTSKARLRYKIGEINLEIDSLNLMPRERFSYKLFVICVDNNISLSKTSTNFFATSM